MCTHLRVMAEKSDGDIAASCPPMDEEERTRHESLFFSQGPIEGLLAGEQARELFLKSNLPLQVLSQIWNLVDIPHDNMLDSAEFSAAMHLIQLKMRGMKLPMTLPGHLRNPPKEEVHLPSMTDKDLAAYKGLFYHVAAGKKTIDAGTVRYLLRTSELTQEQLTTVWNLSDIDRDGRLTCDEFSIACHLTRFLKKGNFIDGPVNVQILFPHKLPKHDLQARRRRLSDLGLRKPKLMALRERRRSEAAREHQRVVLHHERLQIFQSQLRLLQQHDLSPDIEGQLQQELRSEEQDLRGMALVADRLRREHELVRQQTARLIVEEQRMSTEVSSLEVEAAKLRKTRERNSLIKDLDPFHQLHEDRKEEKITGIPTPRKKYEIRIPHVNDPFDREKLKEKPLSGDDVFCTYGPSSPLPSPTSTGQAWGSGTNSPANISELTCGFDDNFIDTWYRPRSDDTSIRRELFRSYSHDSIFEDEDPIFRTIPVTAEEDELWSSLPKAVLANQNEQIAKLQNRLTAMQESVRDLNRKGPQLVFRNPEDYEKEAKEVAASWEIPGGKRRHSAIPASSQDGSEVLQRRLSQGDTALSRLSRPGQRKSYDIDIEDVSSYSPLSEILYQTSNSVDSPVKLVGFHYRGTEDSVHQYNQPYTVTHRTKDVHGRPPLPQRLDQSNTSFTRGSAYPSGKRHSLSRERAIDEDSDYLSTHSESPTHPEIITYSETTGASLSQTLENLEKSQAHDSAIVISAVGKLEPVHEEGRENHPGFLSSPAKSPQHSTTESIDSGKASADTELSESSEINTDSLQSRKPQPVAPPRKNSARKRSKTVDTTQAPDTAEQDSSLGSENLLSRSSSLPADSPKKEERPSRIDSCVSDKGDSPNAVSLSHRPTSPVTVSTTSSAQSTPCSSPSKPTRRSTKRSPKRKAPLPPPKHSTVSLPGDFGELASSDADTPSILRRKSTPVKSPGGAPTICRQRPQSAYFPSESPVAPPRPKRKSKVKLSETQNSWTTVDQSSPAKSVSSTQPPSKRHSMPVGALDEVQYSDEETIKIRTQNIDGATVVHIDQDESKMDPETRRMELENLRAHFFGYKPPADQWSGEKSPPFGRSIHAPREPTKIRIGHSEADDMSENASHDKEESKNAEKDSSQISAVSATAPLYIETGQSQNISEHADVSHSSKVMVSYSPGQEYQVQSPSHSFPSANTSFETGLMAPWKTGMLEGTEPALPEQSKFVINLDAEHSDRDDFDDVKLIGSVPVGEFSQNINISDDTPKSMSIINVGGEEMNTPAQTTTSKIILDLDSHQYVPNIENVPDRTELSVEDEFMMKKNKESSTRDNKVNLMLSGSNRDNSSYDGSMSNYGGSESSAQVDYHGRPHSEMEGDSDDSDISDEEGTFNAMFEPHLSEDMDDHDSGITLVSYQPGQSPVRPDTVSSPPSYMPQTHTPTSVNSGLVNTGYVTLVSTSSEPVHSPPTHSPPVGSPPPIPPWNTLPSTIGPIMSPTTGLARSPVQDPIVHTSSSSLYEGEPVTLVAHTRKDLELESLYSQSSLDNLESSQERAISPSLSDEFIYPEPSERVEKSDPVPSEVKVTLTRSYSPEIKPISRECLITLNQVGQLEAYKTASPTDTPTESPTPAVGDQKPIQNLNKVTLRQSHLESPSVLTKVSDNVVIDPGRQAGSAGGGGTSVSGRWTTSSNTVTPYPQPASTTPDILSETSDPTLQPGMDPVTGLRKTGLITAVDKAAQFVKQTEPSFRVKKKEDATSRINELNQERQSLLDQMRVRRKKVNNWMPDGPEIEPCNQLPMTESERKYVERKKNNPQQPDVIPTWAMTGLLKKPGDVDSRSIADQDRIKQIWEEQIATGDVSLFPRPQEKVRSPSIDLADFKSEVETESIVLESAKKHWEKVALEQENEKRLQKSLSDKSQPSKPTIMNNNIYSYDVEVDEPEYESALDREIRLAEEREKELKREHENLQKKDLYYPREGEQEKVDDESERAVYKMVPPTARVVEVVPKAPLHSQPVVHQAYNAPYMQKHSEPVHRHPSRPDETDSPADKRLSESRIEREIREEQEREQRLRLEGSLITPSVNKEQEQSEYEHQEKEQERISAHESFVEREIRLQREREKELASQRKLLSNHKLAPAPSSGPALSSQHPHPPPQTSGPPPNVQKQTSAPKIVYTEPEPSHDIHVTATSIVSSHEPSPLKGRYSVGAESVQARTLVMAANSHPVPAENGTEQVPYADAISTYAHRGESIIARELREQKEREAELHRRWQEMGVQSPLDPAEEPDTPFNRPDPVQPKLANVPQSQRAPDRSHAISNAVSHKPASPATVKHSQPEKVVHERKISVQPIVHDDDEIDNRPNYIPIHETPIEREIRLAREREEELRREKLLPKASQDRSAEVMLEVKGDHPRRPSRLSHGGVEKATMKRLASSRLQHEMELEKQREMDYKREGKIRSVSDNSGVEKKYVDIISNDSITPMPTNPISRSPATKTPSMGYKSPVTPTSHTTPVKTVDHLDAGPPKQMSKSVSHSGISSVAGDRPNPSGPVKATPPPASSMRQSQSMDQFAGSRNRSVAEARIERELREMREREEELRKQRHVVSVKHDHPQFDQHNDSDAMSHGGMESPTQMGAREQELGPGQRRKSNLAAQWEKKFGGAS